MKKETIGDVCKFNDQLYGGTFLVRPYSCGRIAGEDILASEFGSQQV